MKLAKKLKKTMGLMLISTMVLSAVPTMAADYNNHWAKEAITEWNDYGVVAGYEDGTFKPNNEVKRSELAAFIVRVFGLETTEGATKFADVSANAWYAQDIAKVSAAGIMQGALGKFNPNGFATRQEVAVTLVNAFSLTGQGELNFKDQAEIAVWAKEAVAALASNGYAQGQADNKFAPKANITRAEVVKLLDNVVEQLVHKAGTYTNNVKGNIVVNTKDAVLDGIKVDGNVYLAEGIGLGDATLKNTEVTGNVLVAGGGVNSIHFDKAVVTGGVVVDTKAPVRLVSKSNALKVTAKAKQNIVLTGTFKEVVVPADVVLELKGATVEKLTIVPSGNAVASVTIDKDSSVKELVAQAATQIKGNGKITLLRVQANGITSSIKPSQVEVGKGFDAPTYTSGSTGGGGGGGTGGDNPITPPVTPPGDNDNDDDNNNETPVVNYATIKAITVKDANNQEITLPESAIKVNGTHITVDVEGLVATDVKTIAAGTVTFDNLIEGDVITTNVQIGGKDPITLSQKVQKDGTVSYTVAEVAVQLKEKKDAAINKLKALGFYNRAQAILAELGLSLEGNYLEDDSIDTATALNKYRTALEMLEAKKDQENVQKLIDILKESGINVNLEDKSVSSKVTVKAGQFEATEYTFTIQY